MKKLWKRIKEFISTFDIYSLFFYSPEYKLYNLKWRFHKADVDDMITIPHGHSLDGKKALKLDPYTGFVYDKKEKVGELKTKEFERLWSDPKFIAFVEEARNVYFENNPNASLPDIPVIKSKKKGICIDMVINESDCNVELLTRLKNPDAGE